MKRLPENKIVASSLFGRLEVWSRMIYPLQTVGVAKHCCIDAAVFEDGRFIGLTLARSGILFRKFQTDWSDPVPISTGNTRNKYTITGIFPLAVKRLLLRSWNVFLKCAHLPSRGRS